MVRLVGISSIEIGITVGKALCRIVNQYFPSAIKLCFEKVMTNYCLEGKKRYFGLHWEQKDYPLYVNAKGDEGVRRDNPLFLSRLVKKVQEKLMGWSPDRPKEVNRPDLDGAIGLVQETQSAILRNMLPISDYVTSKTYSKREDDYVGPQEHIEVVREVAKRTPHNAYKLGDRVPYVLVKSYKKAKNFVKAKDPKLVIQENLSIDQTYYIGRLKTTFFRIFTPILAPNRMWKRGENQKITETKNDIEAEKRAEKKYNEKNAHPVVNRRIFIGNHTRRIALVTPTSGGIIDYLVAPRS